MKILQINTVYGRGSVGRIMADLYNLSNDAGNQSYVAFSRTNVPDGIGKFGYRIANNIDLMTHVALNILLDKGGFGSKKATEEFLKWVDNICPDVIHLHNIHGFYMQIELLFDYIKEHDIKVIWTLHDCWPLTGHCAHFDYLHCNRWKDGCHNCPQHITSYPYSIVDNSKQNWRRKKKAYTGVKNLTIVTPSKWLEDIVKSSYLKDYPVKVIPNGIDLSVFNYSGNFNKVLTDKRLEGKKIVLGVANVWTKRKGYSYFFEIAQKLSDEYVVCLVGVNKFQKKECEKYNVVKNCNCKIVPIVHTDSIYELARLYVAACVFINPTLEDNFPTTNLEAMACGTPVITFRTGGSPEAIIDGETGYVVEQGNIDALCEYIKLVANSKQIDFRNNCINHAKSYDKDIILREYLKLYYKT